MTRTFDAVVVHTAQDATLMFNNEAYCFKELRLAFSDGARVTVEVKSRRKPRNLDQNSLWHLWVGIIADETGNSVEAVKTTLKALYAKRPLLDKYDNEIIDKATGEAAYYIQDTRDMSVAEMAQLMTDTDTFAFDFLGIRLPKQNEQVTFNLK